MKVFISLSSKQETQALHKKVTEFGLLADRAHDSSLVPYYLKTAAYDAAILSLNGPASQKVLATVRSSLPHLPIVLCIESPFSEPPSHNRHTISIRKPYRFLELMRTMLSLISAKSTAVDTLRCSDLLLDIHTKRVQKAGHSVWLPKKEFQLLEFLLRNKNKVVTRAEIHDSVWERDDDPLTNAIDVHISRLRKKLGPALIQTAHGFGYTIRE